MANKRDFYEVLGISKSATDADIKSAYRRLARTHHPDVDKSDGAAEKFKEISEAYQVLSDQQKRKTYDQFGHAAFDAGAGGNPFGGGFNPFAGAGGFRSYSYSTSGGNQNADFDFSGFEDPFSLFEQIFGGMAGQGFGGFKQRPIYQMELSFDESVKGVEKTIEIERPEGQSPRRERINIKVPAGVDNGTKMRFGEVDIVFRVKRHPDFMREGADVFSDLTLSIPQIVLGDTLDIKTVEGPVKLRVPGGTEPGSLIRIKNKGIPLLRGTGKGDHYVRVKLHVPKNVTGEEKKLYDQLNHLRTKKKGWF